MYPPLSSEDEDEDNDAGAGAADSSTKATSVDIASLHSGHVAFASMVAVAQYPGARVQPEPGQRRLAIAVGAAALQQQLAGVRVQHLGLKEVRPVGAWLQVGRDNVLDTLVQAPTLPCMVPAETSFATASISSVRRLHGRELRPAPRLGAEVHRKSRRKGKKEGFSHPSHLHMGSTAASVKGNSRI